MHQISNHLLQLCLGAAEGNLLAKERVEDDVLADPALAVDLFSYVDPDRLGLVLVQGEGEGVGARGEDGGEAGVLFSDIARFQISNFFLGRHQFLFDDSRFNLVLIRSLIQKSATII